MLFITDLTHSVLHPWRCPLSCYWIEISMWTVNAPQNPGITNTEEKEEICHIYNHVHTLCHVFVWILSFLPVKPFIIFTYVEWVIYTLVDVFVWSYSLICYFTSWHISGGDFLLIYYWKWLRWLLHRKHCCNSENNSTALCGYVSVCYIMLLSQVSMEHI